MNRLETAALFHRMAELWPNWKAPAEPARFALLVETWFDHLGHVPAEAATAAVDAVALEGGDWPPPLGRIVVEGCRRAGVVLPPPTDEAWVEVRRGLQRCGSGPWPPWSHPLVGEIVEAMGGRRTLRLSEAEHAGRAQFRGLYEPARLRETVEACSAPAVREAAALAAALERLELEPAPAGMLPAADVLGPLAAGETVRRAAAEARLALAQPRAPRAGRRPSTAW